MLLSIYSKRVESKSSGKTGGKATGKASGKANGSGAIISKLIWFNASKFNGYGAPDSSLVLEGKDSAMVSGKDSGRDSWRSMSVMDIYSVGSFTASSSSFLASTRLGRSEGLKSRKDISQGAIFSAGGFVSITF